MMIEMKQYQDPSRCGVSVDILNNIEAACEHVMDSYADDMNVYDAISEAADSCIPIYHKELMKSCADIEEYIEAALQEYGAPVPFRLPKLIEMGYYTFLEEAVHHNMSNILFNRMANTANADPRLTGDDVDPAITEKVIAKIEELSQQEIEGNTVFSDIDQAYVQAMAPFKEGA